ncbi:MAG: FKBP-type peptidyl-prolyl cis-trans isomerase [Muribaculaceae bacterium]|nr:FKBP-type peptidyl-prolyl cis-trans isomerase [Muribaculaceae bacterium]
MSKQEYIEKNRQWLEDKRNEEGVSMLDRGVMYKVIKSGDKSKPSPKASSVVTVHYVGKTINGKTFDSSRGGVAPAFRLRDLIGGWTIALCSMHPGDRWEVYIPAELGYGRFNQPGIPGGSTLVFDIELISVN